MRPSSLLGSEQGFHELIHVTPNYVGSTYLFTKGVLTEPPILVNERSLLSIQSRDLSSLQWDWIASVLQGKVIEARPFLPSYIYILQQTPYESHSFITGDSSLYLFGLYSELQEVLTITNVANYDELLRVSPVAKAHWLHRFKERAPVNVCVNVQRVCKRWSRWTNLNPSQRFTVFEDALFQEASAREHQRQTYQD